MTQLDALKYPIGQFNKQESYSLVEIKSNVQQFAAVPELIKDLISDLDDGQLNNTYREGGWNIKQLVHHLLDSHINSYVRFKLAATEDTPIVKPYAEDAWAETADYDHIPTSEVVITLSHIHHRIVALVSDWTEEDWNRTFYHPGRKELLTLAQNIGLYSWHSRHHLKHIELAISKEL